MRRHQDGRGLLGEESLEPFERGDVEMVRRLVQQQQIGVVQQKPGEPEARPLAARERPYLSRAQRGEAEPGEDPADRRIEVVAARVLEPVLGVGVLLEQLGIA